MYCRYACKEFLDNWDELERYCQTKEYVRGGTAGPVRVVIVNSRVRARGNAGPVVIVIQ